MIKMKETHLYKIPVSESYPKGAIKVKVPIWKGSKREHTFPIHNYYNLTECKEDAIKWRDLVKKELKENRTLDGIRVQEDATNPSSLKFAKTFKNIMEIYKGTPLKRGKNKGHARKFIREEGRYDRLVEDLGDCPPWQVPAKLRERCAYWMDTLDLEPSTVNRHITMAKCAMTTVYNIKIGPGELRRRLVPEDYLEDFSLFEENNIHFRILTEDERSRLWKALPLPLQRLYYHALCMPIRMSDLINIRTGDCDMINGCVVLQDTKSGAKRTLLMPEGLKEYRRKLPSTAEFLHQGDNGYPLGYYSEVEDKYILMSHWHAKWQKAVDESGINEGQSVKYTFHKTRQESAMLLYQAGKAEDEVMLMGGWRTRDAFYRYFNRELALQIRSKLFSIDNKFQTEFAEFLRKVA